MELSECCKAKIEKIEVNESHIVENTNAKYLYVCSSCGEELEK